MATAPTDDFAAQIGSMDRNQLQELINQMNSQVNTPYALGAPGGEAAPGIRAGAFTDPTKIYGGGLSGIYGAGIKSASLSGQYKRYMGRKADKKKLEEYEAAQRAEQERQKQVVGERIKQAQGQIQTLDLRNKVNQQFNDLGLEGLHQRIADQGLQSNMLGISQQFEDLSRQGGFGAARTGQAGSSVDASRLSDTGAAEQQQRGQAVATSQQQLASMNQASDAQRQQLLNSVSATNPGEEARLSGALSNVQNQENTFAGNAQTQLQNGQNTSTAWNNQSQALGGLLNTYSKLYTQNQAKV